MKMPPVAIALCILLGACNTAKLVGESDPTMSVTAADPPNASERVTILGENGDDETSGIDCASKALGGRVQLPASEFRRALFPWFEPGTAPDSDTALAALLHRDAVRQRIASLSVRYVLSVRGATKEELHATERNPVLAVASGGKFTSISVKVWDLSTGQELGTVSASAKGWQAYGVLILVPIIVTAPTQSAACAEVTKRLSAIFAPSR